MSPSPTSTHSFIHTFIHSFPSQFLSPKPFPLHSSVRAHSSRAGSLRQEVLQLQLSAKIPLKGNLTSLLPSTRSWLSLTSWLVSWCMRPIPAATFKFALFSAPEGLCLVLPRKHMTRSGRPCLCPKQHCQPAGFSAASSQVS